MIRIKLGVILGNVGYDALLEPAQIADKIWQENGWGDVVITGGLDGNHMETSKHYRSMALDLRFPKDPAKAVIELSKRLPTWRFILEKDHIHAQIK